MLVHGRSYGSACATPDRAKELGLLSRTEEWEESGVTGTGPEVSEHSSGATNPLPPAVKSDKLDIARVAHPRRYTRPAVSAPATHSTP